MHQESVCLSRDGFSQVPALSLIDSFGIPEHMRHAPIAGDWEKYNETDNFGELLSELQNKSKV